MSSTSASGSRDSRSDSVGSRGNRDKTIVRSISSNNSGGGGSSISYSSSKSSNGFSSNASVISGNR